MAHFAKLDENNVVLEVNVVDNSDIQDLEFPESEPVGIAFLTQWDGSHQNWKQTSYNGKFRKNFAGRFFTYDEQRDAFIAPKPYSAWILNEETCQWEPPIPFPDDGNDYFWNDYTNNWEQLDV